MLTFQGEIRLDILVPDAYRPKYNEERCLHNQTGSILLIILTTICLGLVAGGLILGWVTRKVPFLIFNESKILLFSV
jgi:predicted small integral membrane protein